MKAIVRFHAVLILLAVAQFSGCTEAPASDRTSIDMTIGKNAYTLEVASSNASRTKGLMDRDSLPQNHGMIFVFNDQEVRNFWMHNVRFPLDVVFLDAAGTVVSIRHMEPMDDTSVSSLAPAKYAIELNKGVPAAAGVHVGDRVELPSRIYTSQ